MNLSQLSSSCHRPAYDMMSGGTLKDLMVDMFITNFPQLEICLDMQGLSCLLALMEGSAELCARL